jgi:hypothetical protein
MENINIHQMTTRSKMNKTKITRDNDYPLPTMTQSDPGYLRYINDPNNIIRISQSQDINDDIIHDTLSQEWIVLPNWAKDLYEQSVSPNLTSGYQESTKETAFSTKVRTSIGHHVTTVVRSNIATASIPIESLKQHTNI